MDTVSKKQRSRIMRSVKSKDTKLEIKFVKALKKLGYKFQKNACNYFGKPDIALPKFKTVIFIDSCFWHGCSKHCRMPSSRKQYWVNKIERNKKRDKEVRKYYRMRGFKIFRIWEHSFRNFDEVISKIKISLNEGVE